MTWKQHLPQQAWSVSHRSLLVVICFRPHITRFGACELETLSLRDKPDADIVERRRPQRPSNIAAWMWIFILLENRDAVTRERESNSPWRPRAILFYVFITACSPWPVMLILWRCRASYWKNKKCVAQLSPSPSIWHITWYGFKKCFFSRWPSLGANNEGQA